MRYADEGPNTSLSPTSLRWSTLSIASDREGNMSMLLPYPLYSKNGEGGQAKR